MPMCPDATTHRPLVAPAQHSPPDAPRPVLSSAEEVPPAPCTRRIRRPSRAVASTPPHEERSASAQRQHVRRFFLHGASDDAPHGGDADKLATLRPIRAALWERQCALCGTVPSAYVSVVSTAPAPPKLPCRSYPPAGCCRVACDDPALWPSAPGRRRATTALHVVPAQPTEVDRREHTLPEVRAAVRAACLAVRNVEGSIADCIRRLAPPTICDSTEHPLAGTIALPHFARVDTWSLNSSIASPLGVDTTAEFVYPTSSRVEVTS